MSGSRRTGGTSHGSRTAAATGPTGTAADAGRQLAATGRRPVGSAWLARLARLGLVARGAVYVVIGWMAVQVALGNGNRETDQNGALRSIARTTGGEVLLWLLALGFAGYALWRFTEVAYGEVGGDGGAGGRVKSAVRGIVYAALCVTTISLVTGAGSGKGGSTRQNQEVTAKALAEPFGQFLVGAVGVVLVVVGLALVVEGLQKKFEKYLRMQEMSEHTRQVVEKLGMFGTAARGIVFAVAGVLIVDAAVTYDAKKARGLDGALQALADQAYGRWLLGLLAVGLIAFGIYGMAEARWRRT